MCEKFKVDAKNLNKRTFFFNSKSTHLYYPCVKNNIFPEFKHDKKVNPFECNDYLFIPINFDNTHWCGIIYDYNVNQFIYYDPMCRKSYESLLLHIITLLSTFVTQTVSPETPKKYAGPKQLDSYNCGIYVLTFFECYTYQLDFPVVNASVLELLRYRVLRKIFKEIKTIHEL